LNLRKASERVRSRTTRDDVAAEDALKVYSYYKQATVGDVQGSQPWMVQYEARMKWDAWNAIKGTSKEDAMKKYIEEVERQEKKSPVS